MFTSDMSNIPLTSFTYQRHFLIINHIGAVRAEHDDFSIRFASALNQVLSLFHTRTHASEPTPTPTPIPSPSVIDLSAFWSSLIYVMLIFV